MPTGLVTMVFTDIEGSTQMVQRLGDAAWSEILDAHYVVVRRVISDCDGFEVATAGDGFFITFARAPDAVRFAAECQRALAADTVLAPERVRVRMGVHAGEVQVAGGDYLGLAVHHAARVGAAAHGGQVIVSEPVRVLAEGAVAEQFVDLGEHALKDVARPLRLFQLAGEGLAADFPPVRSLSGRPNNLPRPRSSFVGSAQQLADVRDALRTPGLTTLTGPGGCGKTRLAVEAGLAALDDLRGGAWIVELRDETASEDVSAAISRALGVPEDAGLEAVIARLRGDPTLLILDNCEHLVDACAEAVESLVRECLDLRVIATSRELLGVPEEQARRVASLDRVDGPALFVDRARRAAGDLAVDDATQDTIVRICERLDGIPLAIELAAARVRHMGVIEMEPMLDDMFRVLVGSDRRALQRQQTLEAVIDWSYRLLDADDAAILRALSVFGGGFTLDHVATLTGHADASDGVFRLVDRSLVDRVDGGRYRLLETIRAFAQKRLFDEGEADSARDAHLAMFRSRAETLGPQLRDERFDDVLADAQADVDNYRAALEWALRSGAHDDALVFVRELGVLWGVSGRSTAIEPLMREAIADAKSAGVSPDAIGQAAAGVVIAAVTSPSFSQGFTYAPEALAHYEAAPEAARDSLYGWLLMAVAAEDELMSDPAVALERAGRARAVALEHGWRHPAIGAQAMVANATLVSGDLAGARAAMAIALNEARAAGGGVLLTLCVFWSGMFAYHARAWSTALAFYEELVPLAARFTDRMLLQWALDHLAGIALSTGDLKAARAYSEEGLAVSRAAGLTGRGNYAYLIRNLADIEAQLGNLDQAVVYQREVVERTK
ncbi:MAG TPA: adenylate/guanylate cyclase domain-containing protein, partial [Kofleriaceae bacterium]|nr:adenylate/guanylate cyclase domain-containing protein [Kofleriaceae bacterium]